MVNGRFKSKTFRKVFVRTPGGKTVIQYRRRKPSRARCAHTGEVLAGVACALPSKLKNMPRSAKKPSRPFGGNLSSKAMRFFFKKKARSNK